MECIQIIKKDDNSYILYPILQTKNKMTLASEPFLMFKENNDPQIFALKIFELLNYSKKTIRQEPKDFKEFSKEYLKNLGFKSENELHKHSKMIYIEKFQNDFYIATPTFNNKKNKIFENLPEKKIKFEATLPVTEVVKKVLEAFQRCE